MYQLHGAEQLNFVGTEWRFLYPIQAAITIGYTQRT